MKKYMRVFFPVLFLCLLIISGISVKMIHDIGNYGTLINYVGIVRGASQRLVKLETNGIEEDDLAEYVGAILKELRTGEGDFGLALTRSEEYNANLELLDAQWNIVLEKIREVREGEDKTVLLDESEKLFKIANDTVFSLERYSSYRSSQLGMFISAVSVICLILLIYYIKSFFDLKKTNRELKDIASRDKLTGVYNGAEFNREASNILVQYPDRKFAILYIDIENFKYINDVFGYTYGDEMLRSYAALMLKDTREAEAVGRSIADRFTALRCYEDKDELLQRQKDVDKKFFEKGGRLPGRHMVTVACGICCIEDVIEHLDVQGLIDRANFAQKTVKNDPKLHYAFYNESIRQKMIEENRIRDRIDSALEKGEFVVYLQPKVSLANGKISGAEALARWKLPDGRMLPPGEFIPIMEKNHVIGKLDKYIFEKICIWFQNRIKAGVPVEPVSINVSKLQFYNPDFVKEYREIKDRYNVPDGMLEIEFTETVAFENQKYMLKIVSELHENGFGCSLDDFGSGFSSLGMLKDLQIDVLKLDAMFFRNSSGNIEKEKLIVRSIINMVSRLNIKVVAEGIETQEQVEFLKEAGCDLVQGFVYYKPMPVKEFEKLIDVRTEAVRENNYPKNLNAMAVSVLAKI
ncbi:putative bifunctional diguanylate cyclase/phosphodiesterase [Murimonas intestini]|uniref:putative bifunctional diguanylate cyclase/phosphodiesterase n=1 Tax=Murimonas intestini TaxID=1337051 RepID=UPI0011DE3F6B|nr:bifunctional diguanylate cyclase/phosphodiesterase [Murimonas intestini]